MKLVFFLISLAFSACIIGTISTIFLITSLARVLPNEEALQDFRPYAITRVYDDQQNLLSEYAKEKRIYVKYRDIPETAVQAFISAEDKNFFSHQGVDIPSVFRASLQNIFNITQNKRLIGGSTITQQVIKSFFLTNERSLERKVKEAVLAYRVSKSLSKEKLMEIYLNQIYFGNKSYGIEVAAENYFCKSVSQLTLEESALLAALPKAPSYLNPLKNYNRALERRNWVLKRMFEEDFISKDDLNSALAEDINLCAPSIKWKENSYMGYATDFVKQQIYDLFGEDIYTKGYVVNSTIDSQLQKIVQQSLTNSLEKFDTKSGWRGALKNININLNLKEELYNISETGKVGMFYLAVISEIKHSEIKAIKYDEETITIAKKGFEWILSSEIKPKIGDVILVHKYPKIGYKIGQIPEVNGAAIVIENKTGKILAISGGYEFNLSNFNRATQAYRQPGSAFKTFVYLAALLEGVPPNTLLLDEPLEIELGYGLESWNPKNYKDQYHGLVPLRKAFEKSMNLSTIRLLLGVGVDKVKKLATQYEIYPVNIPLTYSMCLGTYETTLLKIARAYASFGNNGILHEPKIIESVYNISGDLVFSHADLSCANCQNNISLEDLEGNERSFSNIRDDINVGYKGKQVVDETSNYQLLSLLEGSVQRGSARRAKFLKRNIAGKTGTTNNSFDTWFVGLTPDVTIGVFVGHDSPKEINKEASGSNLPLPIFIDILQKATFIPDRKFYVPDAIYTQLVDYNTGEMIDKEDELLNNEGVITEFFKVKNEDENDDKKGRSIFDVAEGEKN